MGLVVDRVGVSASDLEAIDQVALDYLEGYVSGDADRHLRSYHPEAIKRRYSVGKDGVVGIISLSPQTMADDAALQTPKQVKAEIIVDAVFNDIASVRVYSLVGGLPTRSQGAGRMEAVSCHLASSRGQSALTPSWHSDRHLQPSSTPRSIATAA
jgi:hypothetical protein